MTGRNDDDRRRQQLGNLSALATFILTFGIVAAVSMALGGALYMMVGLVAGLALAGLVGNTVGRLVGGELQPAAQLALLQLNKIHMVGARHGNPVAVAGKGQGLRVRSLDAKSLLDGRQIPANKRSAGKREQSSIGVKRQPGDVVPIDGDLPELVALQRPDVSLAHVNRVNHGKELAVGRYRGLPDLMLRNDTGARSGNLGLRPLEHHEPFSYRLARLEIVALEPNAVAGGEIDPLGPIQVAVGNYLEDIPDGLTAKGTKHEYKGGKTGITKISVDLIKTKWQIQAKGIDMGEVPNPITIRFSFGDFEGEATIYLTQKKDNYSY